MTKIFINSRTQTNKENLGAKGADEVLIANHSIFLLPNYPWAMPEFGGMLHCLNSAFGSLLPSLYFNHAMELLCEYYYYCTVEE